MIALRTLFILLLLIVVNVIGALSSVREVHDSNAGARVNSSAVVSPAVTPIFELLEGQADQVPTICNADTVLALFEEFTRRYNARDIDAVLALIQDEMPDWPYARIPNLVPHNDREELQFKHIAMDYTGDEGFIARTHDELREHLAERFRIDERLRLKMVRVAPALLTVFDGSERGSWNSERNAVVGVEFERWSAVRELGSTAGKGVIDCEAGKIVQLAIGPGSL